MRGRGGRAGSRSTRARQGRDVEHPIDLSLEEAYRGAMRRLSSEHEGRSRTVDVRIPAGVGDGSRRARLGRGRAGRWRRAFRGSLSAGTRHARPSVRAQGPGISMQRFAFR
jgi:DnaJ-class molecular chaperone